MAAVLTEQKLPREIIKWLQSLDLSFTVKNPKRDFCNGYLVAEICSRYFAKDVNMNGFENGTRLAAKVDNWEQLHKIFRKKHWKIERHEFDAVLHAAPDAAVYFVAKLYTILTKRPVRSFQQDTAELRPAYMRDTASRSLKDHEIDRIEDNMERTYRAHEKLSRHQAERRAVKAMEAPLLLQHSRRSKTNLPGKDLETLAGEEHSESVEIDEVRVKAMVGNDAQFRGRGAQRGGEQTQKAAGARSQLVTAVSMPRTSVGALAGMQQPALFVKPAADIMRNLVMQILTESEELSKIIDSRKDVVVSFMEHCREDVPEATAVRVFETLAKRGQLLVDTLTKSAPEFWKVWSSFYPALTDFPESSQIFDSAVFLFKRLGDLMRDADPPLTQQLITEVGLPPLAKELARSPEKRESLCQIIYSFTIEDTLNHLLVLRALKDKVDSLPVYICCLACLISEDAQLGLLDEHLLDLYIYYAIIAMQSAQPKVRVAGVSILSTITMCSSQHHSIVALIPSFSTLASDDWWEVRAQLLLLSAHLLSKLSLRDRDRLEFDGSEDRSSGRVSEASASPNSHLVEDRGVSGSVGRQLDDTSFIADDPTASLINIITRLFAESSSKIVLQVGLSALAHSLSDYPRLLPLFVDVLLGQPRSMRERLLQSHEGDDAGAQMGKVTYVKGNDSRAYEEKCIRTLWPHLEVANTFAVQVQARKLVRFELEHMQVFFASLPDEFEEDKAEEWLDVFEKVKQYVIIALTDPNLHVLATRAIKRFWLCPFERIATRSMEASKKTLSQTLRLLYSGGMAQTKVDEAVVIHFLRELRNHGGLLSMEIASVVETFRDTRPQEFAASRLDTVLDIDP